MFGDLMKFGGTTGDLDFYQRVRPSVLTLQRAKVLIRLSPCSRQTPYPHSNFFNYMISDFENDKDFMNYVYNVRVRSLFNCPVDVNEDDELVTFSTCSYEFTNFKRSVCKKGKSR